MNHQNLIIYRFISLIAGSAITGVVWVNHTDTPINAIAANRPILAQAQNSPHLSPQRTGMGMNQQQVDQHFIQMMIPHHQGAVDMANLALRKAKYPELKKLAQAIKTSQTQEIQEMKDWYKKWYGSPVPAPATGEMPMHSMHSPGEINNQRMPMNSGLEGEMMQMMGMMNMDLTALRTASNFDQVFIAQMIPHHQSAVMMAAMVLDSPHPELRKLATAIIQTQSAEIEQMLQWQKRWKQ